jgi:hypothetical protein
MPKGMTNREDPRYKKYFDRLQYGAGLSQIQHDMMRDGVMNYIEILEYVRLCSFKFKLV